MIMQKQSVVDSMVMPWNDMIGNVKSTLQSFRDLPEDQ